MKTTEAVPATAPVPPGNLSTKQLARTLTTQPAPANDDKTTPATDGAAAATREAPPAPKGEEPGQPAEPEKIAKVDGKNGKNGTEAPPAEPAAEPAADPAAEAGAEPTAEPAAEPGTEAERGEGAAATRELPAEVREAIEIAKAQDGGKGKGDLLKRVYKLVDARDTERNARLQVEEQLRTAQTELEQARNGQPAREPAPAGVHPAVAAISQDLRNVDHWLGMCRQALPELQSGRLENLELPDGKGGTLKLGRERVQEIVQDLTDSRTELVARKVQTEGAVKAAFDDTYRQVHTKALRVYPWLNQPTSPEMTRVTALLKEMPQLKQYPDWELVLGDYIRGSNARLAEGSAAGKAPATRRAAPSREPARVPVTPSPSGTTATEPAEAEAQAAESQFNKSGSIRDLAKSLSAKTRASRAKKG